MLRQRAELAVQGRPPIRRTKTGGRPGCFDQDTLPCPVEVHHSMRGIPRSTAATAVSASTQKQWVRRPNGRQLAAVTQVRSDDGFDASKGCTTEKGILGAHGFFPRRWGARLHSGPQHEDGVREHVVRAPGVAAAEVWHAAQGLDVQPQRPEDAGHEGRQAGLKGHAVAAPRSLEGEGPPGGTSHSALLDKLAEGENDRDEEAAAQERV